MLCLVLAGLLDFSSPVQFSASAVTLRWLYALDRLLTPNDLPTVPVNTVMIWPSYLSEQVQGSFTCLNRCKAVAVGLSRRGGTLYMTVVTKVMFGTLVLV